MAEHSGTRGRLAEIEPEHLYKTAGLIFLLALVFRYFDTILRVFLIIYASAIFAIALNSLVRKVPLKRGWVAGLVGLVSLIAFVTALWFGGSALLRQVQGLIQSWPQIELQIERWGDEFTSRIGLDVEIVGHRARTAVRNFFGGITSGDVVGSAIGIIDVVTVPIVIFFGGLFGVARPNQGLLVPFLRIIPAERRGSFERFFTLLADRIGGWVRGQLLAMLFVGILATIAFSIIGVPYALLFGVINGLTDFVPIIGPWAGGIPAVVVAFIDDPMKGVWTALAVLAIQQAEAQLITPFVMSRAADVHPFVTLFALILFGGMFGFLGILLALPLVLLISTAVQVLWVERAIHAGGDYVAPVVEE